MNVFNTPRASRAMFFIGAFMIILSLTFSTFSVAKVLSAPAATTVTVPHYVGFEGYLTKDSGAVADAGAYSITFAVYSAASGGSALWSDSQTSVQVTNGLYSVVLGTGTGSPMPTSIFN